MTKATWLLCFICAGVVAIITGCSRTQIGVPPPPSAFPRNDTYTDLKAGSTLRIVVPLLKSGGFRAALSVGKTEGNTISLSAADLVGYTTSRYAVTGKDSNVRLKFVSAEESRDGKSVPLPAAPPLPFELPHKTEHVRLVYLVRASQADHNMAIIATKRLDLLNTFTARLKEDPSVCHSNAGIFCAWVPAGVAVRPEAN